MGEAKQRLKRFLEKHPRCCFCGGEVAATTEDHQPGRVFFRDRQWPENFSFPACEPCNAAGGDYRLIAAFDFRRGIAFVKFVGTHADYDRVDALTVNLF